MSEPIPPATEPTSSKQKKIQRIGWIALQLLLLVAIIAGVRFWQQRDIVRGVAPPLTGVLLDGKSVTTPMRDGQPLLVHFWASWCPICTAEQGSIESLSKDYPTLTIAMQSGSDAEVLQHLRKENLSFAVQNDPDSIISRQWGVRAVPASFVIDAQGRIRFVEVGYTTGIGLRLRLWLAGL